MLLNVFEVLLAPEEDGDLVPAIAEDYDISDDYFIYTFDLREDVMFHNGDPISAEDVQYAIERLTGEKSADGQDEDYDIVDAVEAKDEETVLITLKKSTFGF